MLGLVRKFKELDTDHSASIDFQEFYKGLSALGLNNMAEEHVKVLIFYITILSLSYAISLILSHMSIYISFSILLLLFIHYVIRTRKNLNVFYSFSFILALV